MSIPEHRLSPVGKGQQSLNHFPATHEHRLRKIGIQDLTFKDSISFRVTLTHHYRNTRLDDSSLFKGNFRQRITKKVTMIQTDISNHTQDRLDDISAIKTTAKTRFKNHIIHLLTRKPIQSHDGSNLEE